MMKKYEWKVAGFGFIFPTYHAALMFKHKQDLHGKMIFGREKGSHTAFYDVQKFKKMAPHRQEHMMKHLDEMKLHEGR